MIHRSCLPFRPRRRSRLTRVLALLTALLVVLPSCQVSPSPFPGVGAGQKRALLPPPAVSAIHGEPEVRVRVVAATPRVTLNAAGPLIIGATSPQLARPRSFDPPVTVTRANGMFVLTDRSGRSLGWGLPALRAESPSGDQALTINGVAYPAAAVLHPAANRPDAIDVVNHLPLEQYLPGVIEHELYGSWAPEAFVAQAIAARSYAIARQTISRDRPYDLESTVADQVYGGRATNPKAIDAVQRTRGQVLVYDGRIVPAFFSSCSGGVGQSAPIAFPDVKLDVNMPPLMGRVHGWGKSSNSYRWGPFSRDVNTLSRRMAAWGRANRHGIANLGTITAIGVASRSHTGRPASFRVRDNRGQSFLLAAEDFRRACNYLSGGGTSGGGLPKLDPAVQLKSSHVDVSVRGGSVVFSNGHGHGHGVGLDQWAAQEMAQAGYTGHAIVTFFYPGASVQRVY